jgi:hypothetical protein
MLTRTIWVLFALVVLMGVVGFYELYKAKHAMCPPANPHCNANHPPGLPPP